jgi:hypothetical protein
MAHYALLDGDNIVVAVITGRDEDEVVDGVSDWETYYGDFHAMTCKRTSYNTYAGEHRDGGIPFRLNYASIGMLYDPERDGFIETSSHFPSWVFNDVTGVYEPPIPPPDDSGDWAWDEDSQSWYSKVLWHKY